MAVFTKLDKEDIESLLKDYSIGKILSYKGIVEGIENSNYKITTKKCVTIDAHMPAILIPR